MDFESYLHISNRHLVWAEYAILQNSNFSNNIICVTMWEVPEVFKVATSCEFVHVHVKFVKIEMEVSDSSSFLNLRHISSCSESIVLYRRIKCDDESMLFISSKTAILSFSVYLIYMKINMAGWKHLTPLSKPFLEQSQQPPLQPPMHLLFTIREIWQRMKLR